MTPDIYYHILEIGFIFEKGRTIGDRWRFGEKKRLLDECRLWRNLIQYAASEEEGKDCSDMAFAGLEEICRKHKNPDNCACAQSAGSRRDDSDHIAV